MHRVYTLREGEMLPLLLTLPPTSLKNLSDYIALRVVSKGMRSYGVVTKVSLKKAPETWAASTTRRRSLLWQELSPEQTKAMVGI